MGYGPYVPVSRLIPIIDEYVDRWGITYRNVARELEAAGHGTQEAWERRLYSWRNGESETCRFDMADKVLSSLYLIGHWFTDLKDIYERAA